jgi:hypothetical protein
MSTLLIYSKMVRRAIVATETSAATPRRGIGPGGRGDAAGL